MKTYHAVSSFTFAFTYFPKLHVPVSVIACQSNRQTLTIMR